MLGNRDGSVTYSRSNPMNHPQREQAASDVAPDFLTHLSWAFGWSEEQAIAALGAYLASTEAGRALSQSLAAESAPAEEAA